MKDRMAFVHFVKSRKKIKNNGIFLRWKPTTSHLGTRAEKRLQRTAKCYARNTIEPNQEYSMKISKIKVKNFRSIKEAELAPSNFNVFVGQNNHGKTNFFESLDWFFSGPRKGEGLDVIRFRGAPEGEEVLVEVEFSGAQEGAQKMKNETNKTKITGLIGESDVVIVRRTSATDPKKRILIINGEEKKNPAGFDSALNDFLPSFEYVSTLINPMDLTKFKANTPIGNM